MDGGPSLHLHSGVLEKVPFSRLESETARWRAAVGHRAGPTTRFHPAGPHSGAREAQQYPEEGAEKLRNLLGGTKGPGLCPSAEGLSFLSLCRTFSEWV